MEISNDCCKSFDPTISNNLITSTGEYTFFLTENHIIYYSETNPEDKRFFSISSFIIHSPILLKCNKNGTYLILQTSIDLYLIKINIFDSVRLLIDLKPIKINFKYKDDEFIANFEFLQNFNNFFLISLTNGLIRFYDVNLPEKFIYEYNCGFSLKLVYFNSINNNFEELYCLTRCGKILKISPIFIPFQENNNNLISPTFLLPSIEKFKFDYPISSIGFENNFLFIFISDKKLIIKLDLNFFIIDSYKINDIITFQMNPYLICISSSAIYRIYKNQILILLISNNILGFGGSLGLIYPGILFENINVNTKYFITIFDPELSKNKEIINFNNKKFNELEKLSIKENYKIDLKKK